MPQPSTPFAPAASRLTRLALPVLAALGMAACAAPDAVSPLASSAATLVTDRGSSDGDHGNGNDGANSGRRDSKIKDARNDFIPSYRGPHNADLDVREAEVRYDGRSFIFTSEASGPIGITPTWLYVWGVDRGAGVARFGPIAPGVTFDMVIATSNGIATVRDLTNGVATVLPASAVEVEGNELEITVPASLLPSRGRTPENFTVNLWPRSGPGGTEVIADFAPDNSMAPVRVKK
jgi:hypothetical protein